MIDCIRHDMCRLYTRDTGIYTFADTDELHRHRQVPLMSILVNTQQHTIVYLSRTLMPHQTF